MGQDFCSNCSNKEEVLNEEDCSEQQPIKQIKAKSGQPNTSSIRTIENEKTKTDNSKSNKSQVEILEYEDGSVYTGEVLNQKRFGLGLLANNKQFYEGEFVNDNFHGFGYVESIKKIAYMGEFKTNLKSGIGVQFSLVDSYIYEGEWKDNHKHGIGREVLPDNSEYTGEFFQGKKHGRGIYKMTNGRKYEGDFKNNKIDGYVILLFRVC